MDYYTKLYLYRSAGVKEYWIVDPMKQTILVYDIEHAAAPAIYPFSDKIQTNIYEDFYINFSDIANLLNNWPKIPAGCVRQAFYK